MWDSLMIRTERTMSQEWFTKDVLRKIVLTGGILIFVGELFLLDYSNLSWANNQSQYLPMMAVFLTSLSMAISIIQDRKERQETAGKTDGSKRK
jgi:hypothetical protein